MQTPQQSADTVRPRRKHRRQEQLSASASFFEWLVQRLMEHQESLHWQFLDAMERCEREHATCDEPWRRQEGRGVGQWPARPGRAQDLLGKSQWVLMIVSIFLNRT